MTERFQRVVLNGSHSEWAEIREASLAEVTSSVVQGSVLGPVLFTIYINDLDASIKPGHGVLISKFADDTKLGMEIATIQDCQRLQASLDELVTWSNEWGMELHTQKSLVIHFGRKNPEFVYKINGIPLQTTESARDLGILIRNDCDTSQHVHSIAKKAHGLLSQLKRAFSYRDSEVLPRIYKTYVRPTLEYAVQVWNPMKIGDIQALEKVQRRALSLVTDQGYMPYENKLQALGIPTLEARRQRGDMIEVFRILNGFSFLKSDDFFTHVQDRHEVETRSHTENHLVMEKCSLNVRKNFFSCRIVKDWNSLPPVVRESMTINEFKNNYDEHLQALNHESIFM